MAMKTLQKDMEELKESMNMMSSDIASLRKDNAVITALLSEMKQLKQKNVEQEKTIIQLESRVSDLEQYSRINDVIISGLAVRPRSYLQAVKGTTSEDGTDHEETTEEQVTAFFKSKNIDIDSGNIEACHTLPVRVGNKSVIPAIIMRFVNRKHKVNLLKQGRNLKGSNVFINDHLTKKNADIAWKARQLRKQDKIQSTWTVNCKVFIKPVGAKENAKGLWIKSIDQLEKF